MANPNTPQGLQVFQGRFGSVWRDSLRRYYIPASQTNAIFVGDPVIKIDGAADANGLPAIDLAAAGAGNRITGVVCGFVPIYGTAPGPMFRPAATTVAYYALVNDDPYAEFFIQENDNTGGTPGTPLPVTAVGLNANLVAGAGNAFTGLSGWQLQANGVATTQNFQLSIKGFQGAANNTPGAAFAKVIVTINQHTEIPNSAGV